MSRITRLAVATAFVLVAAPAFAQDSSWSVSGSVGGVSDYIWRGVSQSQEDPTWQAELAVEHASGFYISTFLSGVDFTPTGEEWDDGIDYEANIYLGWNGRLSDTLTLDLFYTRTMYPGAHQGYNADFNEYSAVLGIGDNYTAEVTYSPNTVNLGSSAMYYRLGGEWDIGDTGFTVGAGMGLYDLGRELGGSYKDYELSLARNFGPIATKLSYHDTSGYNDEIAASLGEKKLAEGRVVLAVGYEF